jgi:hypothetical protein
MTKVLIIVNPVDKNHSYRMINGIKACGLNPNIVNDISNLDSTIYDYIFLEASFNQDCSKLKKLFNKNLVLFDAEDGPSFFNLGLAFETTRDFASAYGKYNYQTTIANPTNLKLIAIPQVDYIYRGSQLAKYYDQLSKNKRLGDVLLVGYPSFFNQHYKPNKNIKFTKNEEINVLIDDPDVNHVGCKAYHQRLDWMYQYSKSDLTCALGLRFDQNHHHFSLEGQTALFGQACKKFNSPSLDSNNYYNLMTSFPIGPSPAGIARSSYRIIELMSLGRIILSTDMEGYKYLYNPKQVITIPDGADIVNYTKEALQNEKELLNNAKENVEIFLTLTPEKMFIDFISQI